MAPRTILRSDGLGPDAPRKDIRPGDRSSRIRLNVVVRFAAFAGAVLILLVVFALVAVLFGGVDAFTRPAGVGPAMVMMLAVICAYAVVVLGLERRLVPYELAPRRLSGLAVGGLCGAAGLLTAYGPIVALGGYRLLPPDGAEIHGVLELMLVAGLGAAVTEELVFRGIGLRLLEEFVGTWAAIAVSGLVFGMIHLTNPDATLWAGIAIALEAGLLLGVLYALTRSLWAVIGYHMLWNIVQGPVLGIPISGNGDVASIWRTSVSGPDWLNGGPFGLEASAVTVALLLTATVVLAVMLVRRGGVVAPAWARGRVATRFPGPSAPAD